MLAAFSEGEASRYMQIFTEELGLVGASARSARLEKSKLRYALGEYAVSLVSLVRGKDVWRLVNAVPQSNLFEAVKGDKGKVGALARVISLLRKLLAGEEKNEGLYAAVSHMFDFLTTEDLSRQELTDFQLIAALKILASLGYVGTDPRFLPHVEASWSKEMLAGFAPVRNEAQKEIKRILTATHLYR